MKNPEAGRNREPEETREMRMELERMRVTMKHFTAEELAHHLNTHHPEVRAAAMAAAKEMATYEISDPYQVDLTAIKSAVMRFQASNSALMPTKGGSDAVIRALLAMHQVKKTSLREEGEKKPKRFEL